LLPSEHKQIVRIISLLVLPHQVQGLCIHDPSDCWVTSGYFSAVCVIINTPMAMHIRHSSSKVNPKVQSRPGVITADYTRRPLNIYDIYHCASCSNRTATTFHCGPVSFFSSAVPLPRMQYCLLAFGAL
jgi:hypothetical protein